MNKKTKKISKASGKQIPLYLQAYEKLKELIREGNTGEILPQERNLALEWGVSRITIRNAYIRLVQDGYVIREPKAYRIAPRLSSSGLFMLEGFTRDALKRGVKPRTEIIGIEVVYPTAQTAKLLMLKPKERVYRIIRKRYLDDRLTAVEYAHIAEKLAPGLDSHELDSLYKILEEKYRLRVHWVQQNFSFHFEPTPQHTELGVPEDKPLMQLQRVSFSNNNSPVEFVDAYYDIRNFSFHLEIRC
jgi:GntR family transcriptional regulator